MANFKKITTYLQKVQMYYNTGTINKAMYQQQLLWGYNRLVLKYNKHTPISAHLGKFAIANIFRGAIGLPLIAN